MADVKLNYREFVENGRVPGTTEHYIMNYEFSSDSGDEIKDNGLYFDQLTQRWYKDFYYASNSDGYSFYFPVMMSVSENEGVYSFKSSAFARQRDADDFVSRVGKACGLNNREGLIRLSDIIINSADQEILKNLGVKVIRNDEGGIIDFEVTEFINFDTLKLEPNYDLIDYIYDLFNQEFGDVSRTYYLNDNDFSQDGEYSVIKNEDLSSTIAALGQENIFNFGTFSPDQMKTIIDEIQSIDDENIRKVFKHNFIRIISRGAGLGPDTYYLLFVGYDVVNNEMLFTNENGTMQVDVEDYVEIYFSLSTSPEVRRSGHGEAIYSLNVYTTPTAGVYNLYGVRNGSGNTITGTAYDSVSSSGVHKPYNLIDGYTFPDRAPDRVSDIPTDGGDPEEEPPQDYWPIGEPSPDPIKVKPPIGDIPPIPRDTPSESTLPDEKTPLSSKGMIHVYNPIDDELSSFSGYLWSEDVRTAITQIWKNNPMDGIISCHELYIQPERDSDKHNILLGYLVADTVGAVYTCKNRYEILRCGYKHIDRFWNNVRDYQMKIGIYLPFIGIRELDVDDVIDSDVYVDYKIDVITGDCTAVISVNRKNSSGITLQDRKVLYMFDGNCSVPIPLTGADRNSLYSGVIGGAISTIGGIMSGNPFAAVGGVMNAVSAKPQIEKSGNLGGNRGAMAFKKPYLIITRPIPNEPKLRAQLLGKPSNRSVRVKDVKGYTVFKQVHVDTIGNATDTEKAMIDSLLKSGVIL